MRMKKFFYALGIGCMLSACSSHEEPSGQEQPDYTRSNKYVSVAIVTSSEGTRALANEYDDGDSKEYDINSVAFFFFDRQGNIVDTELVPESKIKKGNGNNIDPAVTVMGEIEVELVANRVYDSVIAVLNPNAELKDENGKLLGFSKAQLTAKYADYSGMKTTENGTKGDFTMANSVYVNDESYNGENGFVPYNAVSITAHNIYTKAKKESEMNDAEKKALADEKAEKAIHIFVERVCAKIKVDEAPEFKSYFVDKDGTKTQIDVLINNNGVSEEKKITVIPVFKGMGLSVLTNNARLVKNLESTLKYEFTDEITNFRWNDTKNKRSYWESTMGLVAAENGGGFYYNSWNNITDAFTKDSNLKSMTEYVNPNTADATSFDFDKADHTTKLLVCAQLTYLPEGETTAKPLDLVKFSGGYWMADYLLFHAAQRAVEELELLAYTGITDETELTTAKAEVAKITRDAIKQNLSLIRLTPSTTSEEAYLAQLSIKKNNKYPDLLTEMAAGELKTKVANLVNDQIQQTLDDITNRQIQYWKDGMTYFYVPIRHEGFTGLVGGTDGSYLNGVVRNHVYKINIQKIWGLGTPVIEPKDPIDPERPEDAPNSYMTAQIHVLKWRVVSSDLILH